MLVGGVLWRKWAKREHTTELCTHEGMRRGASCPWSGRAGDQTHIWRLGEGSLGKPRSTPFALPTLSTSWDVADEVFHHPNGLILKLVLHSLTALAPSARVLPAPLPAGKLFFDRRRLFLHYSTSTDTFSSLQSLVTAAQSLQVQSLGSPAPRGPFIESGRRICVRVAQARA